MSEELKRYNHLNYSEKSSQETANDDFLDFLYANSEVSIPEVDESRAWDTLSLKISARKDSQRSYFLKIAASVAILLSVTLAVLLINDDTGQVNAMSSNEVVFVTFPDGSKGVLNSESQFTYPEKFGLERRVSFTGEAYFDIVKSKKPFIIEANGVEVKVLGTAFNLVTTEDNVKLYVDRGLVAFSKDGVETKVSAGKEAIFDKSTNNVLIKEIPAGNIMSWRNGEFKFQNAPLKDVLEDLGTYYKVEFKLSKEDLQHCRVSASFDDKSLSEVLSLIETILDVNTKIKGSIVKISGKGC